MNKHRDDLGKIKDLKLCPFCGGEGSNSSGITHNSNRIFYYVECLECSAMGAGCDKPYLAVIEWNKRHEQTPR